MDVYLNDEAGTLYNIVMQTTNRDSLERRIRYYQSAMDRNSLEKGIHYSELGESYIIFVCTFDYFKAGLAVYERENCIKGAPDIVFNDGSHALILNSRYEENNANPAILEFLSFIKNNDVAAMFKSSLMQEVKEAIEDVRNDKEKEVAYMTYAAKMDDMRRDGMREGQEQERENGIRTFVLGFKKYMSNKQNAIHGLMELYGLSQPAAEEKVNLYWQ